MNNILVVNYDNSGEDVMVLNTSLTAEQIKKALQIKKQSFTEVCEVPSKDLEFYVYDPLFATKRFEQGVLDLITKQ